jgi:hypothetical protein
VTIGSTRYERARLWFRIHLAWYLVAQVSQILSWALATPDLFFWPLWSIVFWGLALAYHAAVISPLRRVAGTGARVGPDDGRS